MIATLKQLLFPFGKESAPRDKPDPLSHLHLPDGRVVTYRIIGHPRSKGVRLTISPQGTLRVAVPKRFNRRRIEEIVTSKRTWIAENLSKRPPVMALPPSLHLQAIQEIWQVEYRKSQARTVRVRENESGMLMLIGAVENTELVRRACRRWLAKRGKEVLLPWLANVARETRFQYSKAGIKGQRSRWGSCSARGAISLNYQLLFLSCSQVRYVMIHELCHTKELNHTPAFWELVETHDREFRSHRKALREAWNIIPSCFY